VPNASISIKCQSNGLVSNTSATPKGDYSIQINCPNNSQVQVKASSGPVWLFSYRRIYLKGGTGQSSGKIKNGKAQINVELN